MASLISFGKSSESDRALIATTRSSLFFILDLGISNRDPPEDLRLHLGSCRIKHSVIYSGASPILKSILQCTGSQCNEAKSGVICTPLLELVRTLTVAF